MLTLARAFKLTALVLVLAGAVMPTTRAADREPPRRDADAGGRIDVDMVGVVRTGVMAIGGESTGTTVSALGFTWELDLGGNEAFADLARKANGKELNVKGTLTVKQGVERGRRVIVVVKELRVPGK